MACVTKYNRVAESVWWACCEIETYCVCYERLNYCCDVVVAEDERVW